MVENPRRPVIHWHVLKVRRMPLKNRISCYQPKNNGRFKERASILYQVILLLKIFSSKDPDPNDEDDDDKDKKKDKADGNKKHHKNDDGKTN